MRKGIRTLLSAAVLTAGLLLGCTGNAAELRAASAFSDIQVTEDTISYTCDSAIQEVTAQTQLAGKKKVVTDIYKSSDSINLTYLKGKEATITFYPKGCENQKETIHVNKLRSKVKAKFQPITKTIEVTCNGAKVADEMQYRTSGGVWKDMIAATEFSQYTTKGTTLYIRLKENYDSEKSVYTPYSKQIKIKIPARTAGPKVTVHPDMISFSLPKGCECYFVDGNGNHTEQLDSVSTAAISKAITVNVTNVLSKGGIDISKEDSGVSYAAILHIRRFATAKKMESKETIINIPFQSTLTEDIIDQNTGMDFTYQLNANQTAATGVKVVNHSTKTMMAAILPKDKQVSDIDLTVTSGTDKITWATIQPGKSYVISKLKAVEGSHLVYRTKGTSQNDKTKTPLTLASTIVMDSRTIEYPVAPASDLNLSFSVKTEDPQTASGTSLKVTPYTQITEEGSFYAYEVSDALVKNIKIGAVKASGYTKLDSIETELKVTVNGGQYITVYLLAADGKILAYGSKQVTLTYVY